MLPARMADMLKAAAYFIGFMALVLGVLSLYTVFEDSVSIPIANLISYTAAVFWFVLMGSRWLGGGYSLSNRAVQREIPRLLVIHVAFLVVVLAVQTIAFSLQPRLPSGWLADRGKDPSWFVSALMLAFLLMATAQIYLSRRILRRSIEAESTGRRHKIVRG